MKTIKIQSNLSELSATLFDSHNAQAVLIIASATGVKQTYYQRFAEYISANQIIVITFDYEGIGSSLNAPIKTLTNRAEDWGRNDLEHIIDYACHKYPSLKKCILGHSMGGQLIGLTKSALNLDKIILVAAQSGYWKLWSGMGRVKMWLNWYVLFPTLTYLFGYFPGKRISGMENLPKKVAEQWSGWGRNGEYLLSEIPLAHTVFDKIETSITSFSIDDDDYAPKMAVEWMSNKYSKATVKSVHLVPEDFKVKKIGHFGIFRERFRDSLWGVLLTEMK
nr:alpha/beta fold hydrolase [Allomuricauda sp.]